MVESEYKVILIVRYLLSCSILFKRFFIFTELL